MEVRTGKTLTSLGIAEKLKVETVLFITKKKAIGSIETDYKLLLPSFSICVINYESLHTIDQDIYWDLVICDEAHGMGAFPTASNRASMVRYRNLCLSSMFAPLFMMSVWYSLN